MWVMSVSLLVLSACGGELVIPEGSTTSEAPEEDADVVSAPADGAAENQEPEHQEPAFGGFDLALQDGTWWEYGFTRSEQSFSQGSGSSGSDTTGRFRISLGTERVVGGVTVHEVNKVSIAGDMPEFEVTRWRYLGVRGGDLVGSVDGSNLETILGAVDGVQAGGGFFSVFAADELLTVSAGNLVNDFVQADAIVLGARFEEGRCEYFESVGNICTGERDVFSDSLDYFQPGVGPLGHTYTFRFEDCGGGFCSGSSDQISIGLVDYSLEGVGGVIPDPLEPEAAAGEFVTVTDDTGTLTVDVPAEWTDRETHPEIDSATGAQVPTIKAAPSLSGLIDSFAGSGLFFQATPTPAPEDLIGAIEAATVADAAECASGQIDVFTESSLRLARRILRDCGGGITDLFVLVGELDQEGWTVFVVIQVAAEADQALVEPIVTSLRQSG